MVKNDLPAKGYSRTHRFVGTGIRRNFIRIVLIFYCIFCINRKWGFLFWIFHIKVTKNKLGGIIKCFDTKKAERFFKERGIKYQFVDLVKYGMSKGEFERVKAAVGGLEKMIDTKLKDTDALLLRYLAGDSARQEKLLENQKLIQTPIVRNGKYATVGYCPEIWQQWIDTTK